MSYDIISSNDLLVVAGLDTYNIKKNPRYREAFSSEIVEVDDDDDDDDDNADDFGQDDDD